MARIQRKWSTFKGAAPKHIQRIDSEMSEAETEIDHLSGLLEMLSAKECRLFELNREIEFFTSLDDLETEIKISQE